MLGLFYLLSLSLSCAFNPCFQVFFYIHEAQKLNFIFKWKLRLSDDN